jgi:hypothetical protein
VEDFSQLSASQGHPGYNARVDERGIKLDFG